MLCYTSVYIILCHTSVIIILCHVSVILILCLTSNHNTVQYYRIPTGSRWHCVHIDDPRMPEEGTMLPPLHKCMALSPSDLVDKTYRCRYKDSDEVLLFDTLTYAM